jgi:hypothetical protein
MKLQSSLSSFPISLLVITSEMVVLKRSIALLLNHTTKTRKAKHTFSAFTLEMSGQLLAEVTVIISSRIIGKPQ